MSNNSDLVLGIHDKNLQALCLEINSYADDIATLFSETDAAMDDLKNYFKSTAQVALINSYNEFRKNYPIIKDNINSYAKDYNALMNRVIDADKREALLLSQGIDDIITKEKTIL